MALRAQKGAIACVGALLAAPALFAQQDFQYEVWHGHSRPPHIRRAGGLGTLTINETGVSFKEAHKEGWRPKHAHAWQWNYQDIQQLKLSPTVLVVLTYKDDALKFGADRQYRFDLVDDSSFDNLYQVLRKRLDQRFVAAVADTLTGGVWKISVKRQAGWRGDEGVLQVGATQIVYKSANPKASRTWRYEDVDNISSSGPFDLTITTFEKAKLDYGSRKQFSFQLKRRLEDARYDDLWLRLNQSKGLRVLDAYRSDARH